MKLIKYSKTLVLIVGLLGSFLATISISQPVGAADCGDVKTSFDYGCKSGGDGVAGTNIFSFLLTIVNFMAAGVGIAVIGGIIFGGITISTANGSSEKVKRGRTFITNAVLGLLLFLFMYAIINYIVPGGLFKP